MRLLAVTAATAALALLPSPALAETASVAIGFSNLVARLDETDEIGFAKAEYRVYVLEAMRAAGLNAVGAESLVFSRDDSDKADLLLGGTVREVACAPRAFTRDCRIGIVWEVLDRRSDEIVYRVLSRANEHDLPASDSGVAGKRLVLGALKSLLKRPRFRALLAADGRKARAEDGFPAAQFRSCGATPREMPGAFDAVADATVLVKEPRGFGSGFFLGGDGLVLTAAHVVAGAASVEVQDRSGKLAHAKIVRVSRAHDVALLSIADAPGAPFPCLDVDLPAKHPGSDVYAIGAPTRQDLAFSLTRGIISGIRTVEGTQLIQTDASVSPGNSGGPLLDKQGRVVGVVSASWRAAPSKASRSAWPSKTRSRRSGSRPDRRPRRRCCAPKARRSQQRSHRSSRTRTTRCCPCKHRGRRRRGGRRRLPRSRSRCRGA